MSSDSSSTHVQLLIRSSFNHAEDYTVSCPGEWTILELKKHINQHYPSKPSLNTMRLIFAGANLLDNLKIKDILAERQVVDGPQVFHLVCPLPATQQVHQRRTTSAARNNHNQQQYDRAPAQTSTNEQAHSLSPAEFNHLQAQWAQYNQLSQMSTYSQGYVEAYQEYVRRWQLYQTSLYGHYAPSLYAQGGQWMQLGQGAYIHSYNQGNQNVTGNARNDTNNQFNDLPQEAQPVAAAVEPPAPPPADDAMNQRAGGGDVFDRFARIFKLVMFILVLSMYDISFERLALVLCVGLFLLLIQRRRAAHRHRDQIDEVNRMHVELIRRQAERRNGQVNEDDNAPVAERNEQQNGEAVNNNNHGEQAEGIEVANAQAAEAASPQPPAADVALEGQGVLGFAYQFITSFFMSLVPENVVPVDMN